MPPKFEVRDILRTLKGAELENKLPIYDDGRMIVQEGHIALKADMKFATRKYRAPYRLEELELRQEGKRIDAAGPLYVALTEYKKLDPATPSPLSVGSPGDKRSHPVENIFRDALEKELLSLEDENTSDFERQNTIGKTMNSAPAMEENDVTHEKLMDLEPLLKTSGERNLRSINLTHGECPCHCLAQTVWYPEHSNLCLIWDVEEVRSMGLPDHRKKVTLLRGCDGSRKM